MMMKENMHFLGGQFDNSPLVVRKYEAGWKYLTLRATLSPAFFSTMTASSWLSDSTLTPLTLAEITQKPRQLITQLPATQHLYLTCTTNALLSALH